MKKLSIKEIVEFRSKSERSKKNFANEVKLNKEKINTEGGGDYWVSCLSAISSSFKTNNLQLISARIEDLEGKHETTDFNRTKTMYKRNINILNNYKDFDFKKWMPSESLQFLKKVKQSYLLNIKGFVIQVAPHHVFAFEHDDIKEVGAIWFIAKLNGFKEDELGMFTDILYRYLKANFSGNYNVNSKYCIAVDVFNNIEVNYLQLEKKEVPRILDSTLNAIKSLM
ncbi:hypothetical protein GO730_00735 [Spirosoma sp. HMF3257]|uniref:Uncharacterized protein n=1 Tax=Spirosoma telluris TaxID=2183553 RepID=A0A327NEJ0_9BACT|nr:hypothetical protein [Spirosoma telluris]RAI73325.1 hypothetical protein HMF3257_00715 [Spirosoma telluris]